LPIPRTWRTAPIRKLGNSLPDAGVPQRLLAITTVCYKIAILPVGYRESIDETCRNLLAAPANASRQLIGFLERPLGHHDLTCLNQRRGIVKSTMDHFHVFRAQGSRYLGAQQYGRAALIEKSLHQPRTIVRAGDYIPWGLRRRVRCRHSFRPKPAHEAGHSSHGVTPPLP
jgi:hypothetical protein